MRAICQKSGIPGSCIRRRHNSRILAIDKQAYKTHLRLPPNANRNRVFSRNGITAHRRKNGDLRSHIRYYLHFVWISHARTHHAVEREQFVKRIIVAYRTINVRKRNKKYKYDEQRTDNCADPERKANMA